MIYNARQKMGFNVKNKDGLQLARRLRRAQTIVMLMGAVCVGLYAGKLAMMSWFLGCLVFLVPAVIFSSMVFSKHGAQAAKKIAKDFYRGEAVKIVLTCLLFGLVFKIANINPVCFFGGYIAVQMTVWFLPWIVNNNKKFGM